MARFMFLFRGTPPKNVSQDDAKRMTATWIKWMDGLAQQGNVAARGDALERSGKTVRGRGVTDGPYAEAKDLVGGFIVVEASGADAAAELAKGLSLAKTRSQRLSPTRVPAGRRRSYRDRGSRQSSCGKVLQG